MFTRPHNHDQNEDTGNKRLEGKSWQAGFAARFPFLGLFCLVSIIGSIVGIVTILLISDGENVDTWDSKSIRIAGHDQHWRFGVSAWIALFNFIMGKALAVMFAEAVAISWWVDAMREQTLKHLHFQWEVGQSMLAIFSRRKLWGWVCTASIAFTAFSGLEALVQTASSSTTTLSNYPSNMTTTLANALPIGFSGVFGTIAFPTFGVVSYTSSFTQVLQGYTRQSPKYLELDGCPSNSRAWCSTTLHGVGFQYTCTATRSGLQQPRIENYNNISYPSESNQTVFQVQFNRVNWSITLTALWTDKPGYTGLVVANRNCTLTPALVEYPVNVSQQIATLETPTSTMNWTADSNHIEKNSLRVDKVLQVLPYPQYDQSQDQRLVPGISIGVDLPIVSVSSIGPGTHSTLGGISLALSSLFDSSISISIQSDIITRGPDVNMSGSFTAPYMRLPITNNMDDTLDNTIPSPMEELLSNIRDIMFRSSLAIAQNKVRDYHLNQNTSGFLFQKDASDNLTPTVPTQTVIYSGSYSIYETVYRTNKTILGVAVGLIVFALLTIMPLYGGFWLLGRKVSMSPLEIAKAMHYSTIPNAQTEGLEVRSILEVQSQSDRLAQSGSNFSDDELVDLLGNAKVKFGEVAPNVLGMGFSEYTQPPTIGRRYI